MSEPAPKQYDSIAEIPTRELAGRVVSTLILAKGNINEWQIQIEFLIRELRGEPNPTE